MDIDVYTSKLGSHLDAFNIRELQSHQMQCVRRISMQVYIWNSDYYYWYIASGTVDNDLLSNNGYFGTPPVSI